MSDNNSKEPKNNENRLNTPSMPAYFPTESFKNLLNASIAIQDIAKQNEKFLRQLSVAIKAQDILSKYGDQLRLAAGINETDFVNKSITQLLSLETGKVNDLFEGVASQSGIWIHQQNSLIKMVETFGESEKIWRSHFLEISKFAILSQASLVRLPLDEIGNAIKLRNKTQFTLAKSFREFTVAYANLYDFLERRPETILSFPPVISKVPAIEYYYGVSVLDSITDSQELDASLKDEFLIVEEDTKKETDDRLVSLLAEINADLLVLLQGARLALNSENPDHARHFATSLRELFTQVIHTLAPDDRVRSWSVNAEHYDEKGRPTRRARLLYICRTINKNEFSDFVEKDVDTVLLFLQLFQKGTHQITVPFTNQQLNIMLVRMESALRYLLEIRKIG